MGKKRKGWINILIIFLFYDCNHGKYVKYKHQVWLKKKNSILEIPQCMTNVDEKEKNDKFEIIRPKAKIKIFFSEH